MAREPALGLESLVNQQMLTHDALCGHGKAILVTHTINHESYFELAGLAGGIGIESEWLHCKGLARLDRRRRLSHHATHILQRFDEIGLAARVCAIHHRTAQQSRGSADACCLCMGVLQGLVLGCNKTQHLFVAQASEVLNAELYQHRIHLET